MMKKNDMHFDWKKITEDAFAPNAEPHSFSSEYERRKYGIMNGINNNGGERKRTVVREHRSPKHTVAAIVSIAAAAVIVPTGIAVMNRGVGRNAPSTQVEEATAQVTTAAETTAAEQLSDGTHQAMKLYLSYVPERYISDQGAYCYYDAEGNYIGAICLETVFYSDDVEGMKEELIESFGEDALATSGYSFNTHIDGKISSIECTIIETSIDKAGTGCHKVVFVNLAGTGYFTQIGINDPDLSDQEIEMILAGISFVESDGTAETVNPTDNINAAQGEARQAKELVFGWVPERFSLNTTNAYGKYTNEDCTRGITPAGSAWYTGDFEDIINNEIDQPSGFRNGYRLVYDIRSDDENTPWERIACIGPYENDVTYLGDDYYNRFVVKFRGSDYVGFFFASADVTQDEIKQICGALSTTDADGSITEWQPWTPEVDTDSSFTAESVIAEYEALADNAAVYEVGETFEDNYSDDVQLAYTVNNVTIQDNFDGLTTDNIGNAADFSEYLDESGNIRDEIIRFDDEDGSPCEFQVDAKVVVVDMTVDSLVSDRTADVCICPQIYGNNAGNIVNWTIETGAAINYGNYSETLKELRADNLHFSFSSDSQTSKNNIEIGPNGSANVRVAFIATTDMDELFINIGKDSSVHLGNVNS